METRNEPLNDNLLTRSRHLAPKNSLISKDSNIDNINTFIYKNLSINNNAIKLNPRVYDVTKKYESNVTRSMNKKIDIINNNLNESFNLESSLYKEKKKNNGNSNSNNQSPYKNYKFNNYINKQKLNINKNFNTDMSKDQGIVNYNESIVKQIEELGYTRDYILSSLRNNECNYCTACYYLLIKQIN